MDRRSFSSVPHVQPGSDVSASNTSQSTRALEARTNYLREVLNAIEAGMLLVKRNQPITAGVAVGSAVYWDDTHKQFDLAIAAVTNDAASRALVPAASADCIGICIAKANAATGDIATMGAVELTPAAISTMIDGTAIPGRYYLSAGTAGKLVRQRPPVTVAVAYVLGPTDACETNSWVLINPQMRDFLEDHVHYSFDLVAAPAGTHAPPTAGFRHEITDPDAALPGWLPADHTSFNGTAPAGAQFGYNLAAHPELQRMWPPVPVTAALLEMFQPGLDGAETKFMGLSRVPSDYVQMDSRGIWWMTDCYNQVPWFTLLDTTASDSVSASVGECPVDPPVRLVLSFVKMTFTTQKTVVTSLQPGVNEPLSFVNCDGTAATTGDLYAKLTVAPLIDPTVVRGGLVMKEIVNSQLAFRRGWVAEAVYAGSDAIVLSGSHQERLNPAAPLSPTNPLLHQGIVKLDVQLDPADRELNPQVVLLSDALEREYKGVTYLGFASGRDSAINARFNVPPTGLPANPRLTIRGLLFGRAVGPFAAMQMRYARLVRPTAGTPTPVTDSTTTITFDVVTPSDNYDGNGTNLPADRAIEVSSETFVVSPGDTIFITLSRAKTATPLFQADIGLIRLSAVVTGG